MGQYNRFGYQQHASGGANEQSRRKPLRFLKPRQEICAPLKWLCFALNCVVFLTGVTLLALGVYLWIKDPRSVTAVEDVILNLSVALTIIGLYVSIVSLCGLFGSLRDHATLLKISVWLAATSFVAVVIGVFGLFLIFYADSADIFSMNAILTYAIKKYHVNHNMADIVDYVQENLECCGIRSLSQGYRDWHLSDQFHCNRTNLFVNPYPERCGVPFSCCRKSVQPDTIIQSGSLLPAMRSLECWQNAQTKRPQELENDLYIRGCTAPLRQTFESHAILIGSAVALALIPGLFYVFMEYVLARQIEYQHFLLDREARRNERRRRRAESKRDKQTTLEAGTNRPPPVLVELPKPSNAEVVDQRKRRAKRATTSLSPRRAAEASKPTKRKEKRRRETSAGPTVGITTTSASVAIDPTGRIRQWVLQQSDFVQKEKPIDS
ncbi:Tetraspanin [Aphelenchoides besseyi]|nr:Tetraspanin [Aphelenchoides besseyi]KAI6201616.1 Tetraspanin [Aphelenchoides besseyi]